MFKLLFKIRNLLTCNLFLQLPKNFISHLKYLKNKHKNILLNCKNIVILRTDKLGDMILTLPMVTYLKSVNPQAVIHIIARKYTSEILNYSNQTPPLFVAHFIDDFGGEIDLLLKSINPEVIFYPRPKFSEIFAGFKSQAVLRVGTGYRWYSFLLNHKVFQHRKDGKKNEVEYNIDLIKSVLNEPFSDYQNVHLLPISIKQDQLIEIKIKFQSLGVNFNKPLIVIHPATGGSAKEWHPRNFGRLAKMITTQSHL